MSTAAHGGIAGRLGFSLGLAALVLMPAWDAVGSLPTHARSVAPLGWLAIGTLVVVAAVELVARLRGVARVLAAAVLVAGMAAMLFDTAMFAIDGLRLWLQSSAGGFYHLARNVLAAIVLACSCGGAFWCWRHGACATRRVLASMVAVCAPLPVVVVAGWVLQQDAQAVAGIDAAVRTTVVLVFDELDATMIDSAPTPLPHFKALQARALSATTMYPPANYTSESLPAMLTGEDYDEATYTRRSIFVRPLAGSPLVSITTRPSLLDADSRSSVVGWHLPYCAVYRRPNGCWDDAAYRAPGVAVPLWDWLLGNSAIVKWFSSRALARYENDVAAFAPRFFDTPDKYRLQRIGGIFAEQRQRLLAMLTENRSELVFAHLACPHPPALARRGPGEEPFAAYMANLVACDALLGEVQAMLQRRVSPWQLIVTSDHWFRMRDWRASGRPLQSPDDRHTVPFYVLIDGAPGAAWSTTATSNSRVLGRVVEAARRGELDYAKVRALVEAEGDRPTRLRPF